MAVSQFGGWATGFDFQFRIRDFEGGVLNFTKEDGRKVMILLVVNWAVAVLLSTGLVFLSHRVFASTFAMFFAVFCGVMIVTVLGKRDFVSAALVLGGGLILFAITVTAHSALFPPDIFPV